MNKKTASMGGGRVSMLHFKESRVALACFIYSYFINSYKRFKKTYTPLKQTRKYFLITDYFESYLMRFKRGLNTAAIAGRRMGEGRTAIIVTLIKHREWI